MSTPLINPAAASAGSSLSPKTSFGNYGSLGASAFSGAVAGSPAGPLGSLIGAGVSALGNYINSRIAVGQSKELYDYQTDYSKLMDRMVQAGINPGAAAQGLSNATPSMQSVSSPSFPDLSSLGSVIMEAERNPSIIAKNQADTMLNQARVSEISQMLDWNPRRWQSEIDLAKKQAGFYGSQALYYDEFTESVKQKRPWEIAGLKKGLQVMSAEISQRLASAELFKQQKDYYKDLGANTRAMTFINRIQGSFWREGINPNEPPIRSLLRLSLKDPKAAEGLVNHEIKFLGILDNKVSDVLGKNWKKYAAAGAALHYINNRMGEHSSKKAARNADRVRSLVGLMSVAGSIGTGSPAPAMIAPYFMGPGSSVSSGQYINDPLGSGYVFPFGSTNMW